MFSIRGNSRLLLVFSILEHVKSAPVQGVSASNSTATPEKDFESAWVAGPQRRGTLIILFSCILTLILCIWTTVHSNIEPELWDEDEDEGEGEGEEDKTIKENLSQPQPRIPSETRDNQKMDKIKAFLSSTVRLFSGKGGGREGGGEGSLDKGKAAWSLVTLLFPEITLCIAAHERRTAILLRDEMLNIHEERYKLWDMTLAYYAIMGGIVIGKAKNTRGHLCVHPVRDQSNVHEQPHEYPHPAGGHSDIQERPHVQTIEREQNISPLSEKPSVQTIEREQSISPLSEKPNDRTSGILNPDSDNAREREREFWGHHRRTLTPRGVYRLACLGKLPKSIKPQTVKDKSKANLLAKCLVCFQAIWIIVQGVGRYIEGLPVTLLELYTMLHTMCAVAMYLTWMEKPFGVEQPTIIHLSAEEIDELLKPDVNPRRKNIDIFWNHGYTNCLTQRAGLGKLLFRQLWDWEAYKLTEDHMESFHLILDAYRALWSGIDRFWMETVTLSLVGFAYGGLHLLAWNYKFPSKPEHTMWQIASVLTSGTFFSFCATIPVGYIGMLIWEKIEAVKHTNRQERIKRLSETYRVSQPTPLPKKTRQISDFLLENISYQFLQWFLYLYTIGFVIVSMVAILGRIYFFIESFAAMRRLQIGSYDVVQWGNFMPHFG